MLRSENQMQRTAKPTHLNFSVRVRRDQIDRLRKIAKREQRTAGAEVRLLIERHIAANEEAKAA